MLTEPRISARTTLNWTAMFLTTNGPSDCSLTCSSGVCGDADTIDASSLNLACLYNPTDVVQSIGNKLLERQISPKIIKDTCAFVAKSTEPGDDALNAINKSIEVAKHSAPKGFQIIRDNLDLHIMSGVWIIPSRTSPFIPLTLLPWRMLLLEKIYLM